MIGTLRFKLPQEQDDFEHAQNAHKYLGAIQDFDSYLRSQLKYCELDDSTRDTYERLRTKLHECCSGFLLF